MTLNILFAIPVYAPAWQYGGPILSVSRLAEALVLADCNVRVITTNSGIPDLNPNLLGKEIQRNGVKVTYYPVDQQGKTIRSSALISCLPQALKHVDLIHMSAIWQPLGIPIQKEAFKLDIPVLHSLRGALSPYSWKRSWWKKFPYYWLHERYWLQKASGLHVTTEQEVCEVKKLGLKVPIYCMPNPVSLKTLEFNPNSGKTWRRDNGVHEKTPIILLCGRQHHKKGLDILPFALNYVREKDWLLLIVGEDEDGSGRELIRALRKMNLRNRIKQLPSQSSDELGPIYNAADLLLLPSRHENFGNVVIEALACGCKVLVSDQTGVGCDLTASAPIDFGGVLARERTTWGSWLQNWLTNPQRAGMASALWVSNKYNSAAIATQSMKIYNKIIGEINS